MESIREELKTRCKNVLRYGKIITDISVPSVNSRFINIQYNDTIYFIRMMDGEFMTLQNLNDDIPVFTEYSK